MSVKIEVVDYKKIDLKYQIFAHLLDYGHIFCVQDFWEILDMLLIDGDVLESHLMMFEILFIRLLCYMDVT